MYERIAPWMVIGFALTAVVLSVWSIIRTWRTRRRERVNLCPGPWLPWWRRLLMPHRLLFIDACGYDLRGLAANEDGSTWCPECGRRLASLKEALRTSFRVRFGRIAILLVLASGGMWFTSYFQSGRYVKYLPSTLLALEFRISSWSMRRWALELEDRAGKLRPWQNRIIIPSLIDDLANDDERFNGEHAVDWLCRIGRQAEPTLVNALNSPDQQQRRLAAGILLDIPEVEVGNRLIEVLIEALAADDERYNAESAIDCLRGIGIRAEPALFAALDSNDWQQRQLAAYVLYDMPGVEVNDRLIEVAIEALADDDVPFGSSGGDGRRASYSFVFNAASATRFLLRVGDPVRLEPHLATGLASRDDQQRFLCATVVSYIGLDSLAHLAAPSLIDHLRHNEIGNDAIIAMGALFRLGEASRTWLQCATYADDPQLVDAAKLILMDLDAPPRTWHELERRSATHTITNQYHDPAIELSMDKLLSDIGLFAR